MSRMIHLYVKYIIHVNQLFLDEVGGFKIIFEREIPVELRVLET
jgi:hypothetical protein